MAVLPVTVAWQARAFRRAARKLRGCAARTIPTHATLVFSTLAEVGKHSDRACATQQHPRAGGSAQQGLQQVRTRPGCCCMRTIIGCVTGSRWRRLCRGCTRRRRFAWGNQHQHPRAALLPPPGAHIPAGAAFSQRGAAMDETDSCRTLANFRCTAAVPWGVAAMGPRAPAFDARQLAAAHTPHNAQVSQS
jgi:hypothetical protein